MKTILFLSIPFVLFSCGQDHSETTQYSEPEKVIVSGKVLNPDTEIRSVRIAVNRIGFGQEEYESELDDEGNFSLSFETYLPVDAWMIYKTNFLIIVHPGDSLNILFDGNSKERPEILKSIVFNGGRKEINNHLAAFQRKYFASELYTDWARKDSAIKHYNPDEYLLFADSLHESGLTLLEEFVEENSPGDEFKQWAQLYLTGDYFTNVTYYPMFHRQLLNLKNSEWDVPSSYYDYFSKVPEIDESLESGYAIAGLSNKYLFTFVGTTARKIITNTFDESTPLYLMDSVYLQSIVELIPDTLFRQVIMTEYLNSHLNGLNIDVLDRYMDMIKSNIKQPFLLNPLLDKYHTVDSILVNSKLKENVVVKDRVEFSSDFLPSIISQNKGKVIYVDIWATWCGPCLRQFEIMDKFHKSFPDVAYIYLCIDSKEKPFYNVLKKFQLAGDHYYFKQEKGDMIREILGVTGVPNYIIIDKEGKIIKRGFDIRPSEKITSETIRGLL